MQFYFILRQVRTTLSIISRPTSHKFCLPIRIAVANPIIAVKRIRSLLHDLRENELPPLFIDGCASGKSQKGIGQHAFSHLFSSQRNLGPHLRIWPHLTTGHQVAFRMPSLAGNAALARCCHQCSSFLDQHKCISHSTCRHASSLPPKVPLFSD